MENNNKGSQIFLGVIGVATLVVAIIGATFAFFGAQTTGGANTLKTGATTLALGFDDETKGLNTALIPAENWIANYAAMTQKFVSEEERTAYNTGKAEGEQYKGNLQCIDDYGNEVCSVYQFTIANPSATTAQPLYASLNSVTKSLADLYFRIYDEDGREVVGITKMPDAGKTIALPGLEQTLLATGKTGLTESSEMSEYGAPKEETVTKTVVADSATPTDTQIKLSLAQIYTLANDVNSDGKVDVGDTVTMPSSNMRTYTMVMWIEEDKTNQTDDNAGGSFAGSLYFTTASGTNGVTGIIATAMQGTAPQDPTTPGTGAGAVTDTETD